MALAPEVKAFIEIILKDRGTREAVLGIKEAGREAEQASGHLGTLGDAAGKLWDRMKALLGISAVFALFRSGVEIFAKLERGFEGIAKQIDAVGGSSEKSMPVVKSFLSGLQTAGNGLLTETVPAFQRFLGLTHDVNAAIFATKLASEMGESGMGTFGEAAEVVASVLSGRPSRALKQFGVNITQAADGSADAGEAMRLLANAFPIVGQEVDDTQNRLQQAEGVWADFKATLGETASRLTGALAPAMRTTLNFFKSLGPLTYLAGSAVATFATYFLRVLDKLLDAKAYLHPKEMLDAIQTEFNTAIENVKTATANAGEEIYSIWNQTGEEAGRAFDDGRAKAEAQAAAKSRAEEIERLKAQALKRGQEIAAAEIEGQAKAFADARAKRVAEGQLALQLDKEQLEARLKLTEEGSKERQAIELELLEIGKEEALQKVVGNEEARLQVEATYALLRLAVQQKHDADVVKSNQEALDKIREAWNDYMNRREHDAKELEVTEAEAARRKVALQRQLTASLINLVGIVFGQNKAAAIAQSIINTAEGVTAALKTPVTYPLIPWIIATGAVEIATIQATSIGSSGGGGGRGGRGRGRGGSGVRTPSLGGQDLFAGPAADFRSRDVGASPSTSRTTNSYDQRTSTTHVYDLRGAVIADDTELARRVRAGQRRDRRFVK